MNDETSLASLETELEGLKKIQYVKLDAAQKARYSELKKLIEALKVNEPDKDDGSEEDKPSEPTKSPDDAPAKQADVKTPESPQAMTARTKKMLEEGPQMTIAIALAPGEKAGAKESVTINGYRREFVKGVQVSLPVPMAELVLRHHNIGIHNGIADEYRASSSSAGKNLGDISSD